MEYSPKKIIEQINEQNFSIKKKYGQNFIIDENIINNIITKSGIDKKAMVIEIGPGLGALTNKLASTAQNVLCYEIDTTLKAFLDPLIKTNNNIKIIYNDFLKVDIKNDLIEYHYDNLYVIANLPYYITTPILMKIIESGLPISKIIIMVQKEVGDRFKALPGSKEYNSLSVFLSYYYDIKKVLDVSKNVFLPKPNVDSIVLELKRKDNPYVLNNSVFFFQLVRDSFKQKRKTIKNNLANYDLVTIEKVLNKYNLNLTARAEQISLEVFVDIANNLIK